MAPELPCFRSGIEFAQALRKSTEHKEPGRQGPASRRIEAMRGTTLIFRYFWYGSALLGSALLIGGGIAFVETGRLVAGMDLRQLLSFGLATYGNTLLAAATSIYLANLWFGSEMIGKWGSRLAVAGATLVLAGFFVRWYEMDRLFPEGGRLPMDLYGLLLLVSAAVVLAYLAVETAYRNRGAGAFFMPIILCAVAAEIWMLSHGQGTPHQEAVSLVDYWAGARTLAEFIGFTAFAVTAVAGAGYLMRYRAEAADDTKGFVVRRLPNLWQMYGLMFAGVAVGVPVFCVAIALGAAWTYDAWGSYGMGMGVPQQEWSMVILLVYSALFAGVKRLSGLRFAWWSVIGFAVAGLVMFGLGIVTPGQVSSGA